MLGVGSGAQSVAGERRLPAVCARPDSKEYFSARSVLPLSPRAIQATAGFITLNTPKSSPSAVWWTSVPECVETSSVLRPRLHDGHSKPLELLFKCDSRGRMKLCDFTKKRAHPTSVVVGGPRTDRIFGSLAAPDKHSESWHPTRVVRQVCKPTKDVVNGPGNDYVQFHVERMALFFVPPSRSRWDGSGKGSLSITQPTAVTLLITSCARTAASGPLPCNRSTAQTISPRRKSPSDPSARSMIKPLSVITTMTISPVLAIGHHAGATPRAQNDSAWPGAGPACSRG